MGRQSGAVLLVPGHELLDQVHRVAGGSTIPASVQTPTRPENRLQLPRDRQNRWCLAAQCLLDLRGSLQSVVDAGERVYVGKQGISRVLGVRGELPAVNQLSFMSMAGNKRRFAPQGMQVAQWREPARKEVPCSGKRWKGAGGRWSTPCESG